MEKRGIVEPGTTPPEHEESKAAEEKRAQVAELDNDFRKRAAAAAKK
jgi:hypothetical protein